MATWPLSLYAMPATFSRAAFHPVTENINDRFVAFADNIDIYFCASSTSVQAMPIHEASDNNYDIRQFRF